jgi:hypothetical protein
MVVHIYVCRDKISHELYDKLWCIKPKKFITGDFSSLMPLLVLDQKKN